MAGDVAGRLPRVGRWGWLIAVVALVAGCTAVADGMAVPATDLGHDPAPVPVAALDGLLLPPEQLDALLNTTGLAVKESYSKMSTGETTSNDCAATWRTAWGPAYEGSGWLAVRDQYLDTGDDSRAISKVFEAVVSFPLPVDANAFYRKQVAAWPTCNNRRLEKRYLDEQPSPFDFFKMGQATEHDGMLTMPATEENDDRWTCERVLTVRNNIAIDVEACADHATDQGETVTKAIAAKVPVN